MAEDTRIDRLFDYTKWHLGIYLATGGLLGTTLSAAESPWFLPCIAIGAGKWALVAALAFVIAAGVCGGVVASSLTLVNDFRAFWDELQGPTVVPEKWRTGLWLKGSTWATLEHVFFWCALAMTLVALAVSTLSSDCPS